MGFFADGWSRVKLTGSIPASTQSGFPALITGANIPASVFTDATDGGGDLRIAIDAAGNNQLPLEVVAWVKGSSTADLRIRFVTYSSVARELYLFYNKIGEIQPAVTDAFGRNAVWQDYHDVRHFAGDTVDSSGNNPDGVINGPTAITGGGYRFTGSGDNNITVSSPAFTMGNTATFTVRALGNAGRAGFKVTIYGTSAGGDSPWVGENDATGRPNWNTTVDEVDFLIQTTGTAFADDVEFRWDWVQDVLGTSSWSIDGVEQSTKSDIGSGNLPTPTLLMWGAKATSDKWTGDIYSTNISKLAKSSDLISLEQSNESNPASFWTTGTPEVPVSGGLLLTNRSIANFSGMRQ